ncbi:MAG: hypothetical protein SXV54_22640 [Chloroflexota bacterium]|nr:hypothetical protein [Chloroflexota bacterium]
MVNIADELAHATKLVRTFAREGWEHTIDKADQDALTWLLEIVGEQHAYIRSQAFRDVVAAAYQIGWQEGIRFNDK